MTNLVDILKCFFGIPILFLAVFEIVYFVIFLTLPPWELAGVVLAIGIATGGTYFIFGAQRRS